MNKMLVVKILFERISVSQEEDFQHFPINAGYIIIYAKHYALKLMNPHVKTLSVQMIVYGWKAMELNIQENVLIKFCKCLFFSYMSVLSVYY
jgi:hypothetical protein